MTAVGLSYNLAAAAFGGTAAVIGTALCSSHFPYAPGLYLTGVACLSTPTLLYTHMVKDRAQDLDYPQQQVRRPHRPDPHRPASLRPSTAQLCDWLAR